MDNRKIGVAAALGAALWTTGGVGSMLDDLEYSGLIADNPMPWWLTLGGLSVGSVLLIVALWAFQQAHQDEIEGAGRVGSRIAFAGLGLSVLGVWPFLFFGPLLTGIGLTLYGIGRIRLGGEIAAGAWPHALCFPGAVVAGLAGSFFWLGAAVSTAAFAALIGVGFVRLGLSLSRPASGPSTGAAPVSGGVPR